MGIWVKNKVEAMRLLIKGGKIAAEEGPLIPGDVLVADGVITAVREDLAEAKVRAWRSRLWRSR